MGATDVLAGLVVPDSKSDFAWRFAILLGMITGPSVVMLVTGSFPTLQVPGSSVILALGGIIVGLGVTFGGGCTSGHGVFGMARLSSRSLVATIAFMIETAATVYVLRHVLGVY